MDKIILVLSLIDRSFLDESYLKKRNINIYYTYNISDLQKYIRRVNPDALLVQVTSMCKDVINSIKQISKVYGYSLPWLCYVTNNTKESEFLARSNNVFYYGVGLEDIINIYEASFDAVNVGREQKMRLEKMFNNISERAL